MAKRIELVSVPRPCARTWHSLESTSGASAVRVCDDCHKTVHNLSLMTRAEGERLLRTADGKLCVAFSRGADGAIVTADRRSRFSLRRPFDGLSAAALAAFIAVSQPAAALAASLGGGKALHVVASARKVQYVFRGLIMGRVVDPIGEPLPGATVTARGSAGEFTTQTGEDGRYLFQVPVGSYTVVIEELGFNSFGLPDVHVWWSLASRVDAQLNLGLVGETVAITRDGNLVAMMKAPVRAVRALLRID